MTQRKLASIQRISEVKPIANADSIEHCRIGGWWVVGKKGQFTVNDLVCYVEIDSWIPHDLAPFLSKGKEPRVYEAVSGERLRTVKLRGAISQGLLLPLESIQEIILKKYIPNFYTDSYTAIPICFNETDILAVRYFYESDSSFSEKYFDITEGQDVTEELEIIKWEPPAEFKHADAKGTFPSFILKTDQPRLQNIHKELTEFIVKNPNVTWEVTEKAEGSSCTIYYNKGDFGICSRNLQLKEDIVGNTFIDVGLTYKHSLIEYCEREGRNLAIQGELIGPGIQGNIYGLSKHEYRVFDVFDIDAQRYLDPWERAEVVREVDLQFAPVIEAAFIIQDTSPEALQGLLELADGATAIQGSNGGFNSLREGLCYKANTTERFSFKTIGTAYLLGSKI